MKPPNLLRLAFSTSGVRVEEHGPEHLELFSDDWILSFHAVGEQGLENLRAVRPPDLPRPRHARLDVLNLPGPLTIEPVLLGIDSGGRAQRIQYLLDFGEGGAYGLAHSRNFEAFDGEAVDRLIRSMRLEESPRTGVEVLPAWRAYQRQGRRAGLPIAKFRLSMAPAPIMVGEGPIDPSNWSPFTDEEFGLGGRQIAPRLFEFYSKGDPSSVRIDLWLETPAAVADREAIFEARLDLTLGSISFFSLDAEVHSPVPPGRYDVSVTRVNRDRQDERSLVDREVFARDDLERYEVQLKPRADRPAQP